MSEARRTYAELFKLANNHVKTSSPWQKALPWLAGGGLLTAGVGIPLAHRAGRQKGESDAAEKLPWAFGAGALTGLAGPSILRKLKSAAGAGLTPGEYGLTDEFTEF